MYRLPSIPTSFFDTFSSSLKSLNILYFLDVSKPSPLVSNFCNIINSYNLILSNTGHTRTTDTTATTIDVMLSSTPSLTRSCDIIPPLCSSDHNSILAYIIRTCATQRPPQHPRLIWQYDHADFNLANELLSQVDTDSILMEDDINTSWAKWEAHYLEIMNNAYHKVFCLRERICNGYPNPSSNSCENVMSSIKSPTNPLFSI